MVSSSTIELIDEDDSQHTSDKIKRAHSFIFLDFKNYSASRRTLRNDTETTHVVVEYPDVVVRSCL